MQPPEPPDLHPEWEDVSLSSIEESPPRPLREIIVGSAAEPPGLAPTRFADTSPEQVELMRRHALHNGRISARLPEPGDRIADTYRIESELGGGSMGERSPAT